MPRVLDIFEHSEGWEQSNSTKHETDKEPHSRIQAWHWDRERRYYNRPSTYQVHTRKTNETNGSGGEAVDSIPHRFWFGRAFISSWKRWWCFCVLLGCDLEFLGPPATMNIAHGGILHGTAVASECECPSFSFNVPSIWNFLVKCWNSGPEVDLHAQSWQNGRKNAMLCCFFPT